jgi:hypothetical protein
MTMFYLTENHRSYQLGFVLNLVFTYVTSKFWPSNTVLVTHKGKALPCNILDIVKILFSEDKVYTICEKKFPQKDILTKVEAYQLAHSNELFAWILEGRHRAVALVLAKVLFDVDIEPNIIEVDDERAKRVAFESNLSNEQFAKMLGTEKLQGVVELINSGVYKQQKDIAGLEHGQQQLFWHRAQAVIVQGVSLEDAMKFKDYKSADAVAKGEATAADTIAGINSKNKAKVLPGEKIRDCAGMCRTYDAGGDDHITKALEYIVNNAETNLKAIIATHFRDKAAAATAQVEAIAAREATLKALTDELATVKAENEELKAKRGKK